MAGSLFRNYPYDVPTEAFSLNLFRQVRADLGFQAPACGCTVLHGRSNQCSYFAEYYRNLSCMLASGNSIVCLRSPMRPYDDTPVSGFRDAVLAGASY